MTFKKRYLTEVNGVNSIADLKELADYHSSTKDLFNNSAPFMKQEERQTVSNNQHEFGQSVDKKWSDRFNEPQHAEPQHNEPQHNESQADLESQTATINNILGDTASPDSVNTSVSGLADMFG